MTDLLGVLRKAPDGSATVHFDRFVPVDRAMVWDVVTNPEQLGAWFATVEGALVPRGSFTITFEHRGPERCRILTCDPPRGFSFEWWVPQPTLVQVNVLTDNRGTRIELTHEHLPTSEGPRYAAGWDAYLHVLTDHLGGSALRSWQEGADAVRVGYAQQMMD